MNEAKSWVNDRCGCIEHLESRVLLTAVHVTATAYQYAGHYGGQFAGNNER